MTRIIRSIYVASNSRLFRRMLLTPIFIVILLLFVGKFFWQLASDTSKISINQEANISRYSSRNRISNHWNKSQNQYRQSQPATIRKLPNVVERLLHRPPDNSKIIRAILLFYPNDQDANFQPELRWFYRSWIEMMTAESSLWRTDLIIYMTEFAALFKELGCVFDQIRKNPTERPMCRVFPYIRVKDRHAQHESCSDHQKINKSRSIETHHHLKRYGYVDSINTVLEYKASYEMYDFVLRTDMDCFLTKQFAHYVPVNNSLIVGYGGYSTGFNNRRLKRIAQDMGWKYADRTSLGSTWYGPPSMTYRLAEYTVIAMMHLSANEFSTPEREQKLGVMLWPEWHYGVLLLYGGHLAINHLVVSEKYDIGFGRTLLDQGVTSSDQHDIERNVRLHLHCWHGDEMFSKFAFKAGKYDKIDPKTLLNNTSASGYATRLALEAKQMPLKKLYKLLLDISKN